EPLKKYNQIFMESIFQYQSESSDTEIYEIEDESVQSATAKVEPTQKPKRKASTSETVCLTSECSTSTPEENKPEPENDEPDYVIEDVINAYITD
ncbi:12568_t:CDS:2, partial [Dentiscutata heterogama]